MVAAVGHRAQNALRAKRIEILGDSPTDFALQHDKVVSPQPLIKVSCGQPR